MILTDGEEATALADDGSSSVVLVNLPKNAFANGADWSPPQPSYGIVDGDWVTYLQRGRRAPEPGLHVFNSSDPAQDHHVPSVEGHETAWSPRGDWLAVAITEGTIEEGFWSGLQLVKITNLGDGLQPSVAGPYRHVETDYSVNRPTWSPDGARLAASAYDPETEETQGTDVRIWNFDTANLLGPSWRVRDSYAQGALPAFILPVMGQAT